MDINFENAKKVFDQYVNTFDINNKKILLKKVHTYGVVEISGYISTKLNLSKEDIELSRLIALLHDIGRFEQIKLFNSFNDNATINHATLGLKILFDDNMIRDFIETDKYDKIIYTAISNHNRYSIEDNLTDLESLHSKIIRDADKTDIFRILLTDTLENLQNSNTYEVENGVISSNVYNSILSKNLVCSSDRITPTDFWISHLAYIFDYNFVPGLKYIKDNDYVQKISNKYDYKNTDTQLKAKNILKCCTEFLEENV